MYFLDIPDEIHVDSPPDSGTYRKEKRQSHNLYCWFHTRRRNDYPHISITDTSAYGGTWDEFHVTYPLVVPGNAWTGGGTERKSHSVYYKIVGGKPVYKETKSAISNNPDIRNQLNEESGGIVTENNLQEVAYTFALRFVQGAILGAQ